MKQVVRLLVLSVLAFVALQLYFVGRIAAMTVVDPQSTAFERSRGLQGHHRNRRPALRQE